MILKLNGLAVECIIGDLPKERSTTQTLRIDAELDVAGQASETDGISDAVDYAALSYAIRDALVAAKCRLIERAAKSRTRRLHVISACLISKSLRYKAGRDSWARVRDCSSGIPEDTIRLSI